MMACGEDGVPIEPIPRPAGEDSQGSDSSDDEVDAETNGYSRLAAAPSTEDIAAEVPNLWYNNAYSCRWTRVGATWSLISMLIDC